MRRISTTVVSFTLAFAVAGLLSGTAGAVDKIKVTMASQGATYASYLNGIAMGYYKQEGLDLDVIKAGGGTATPALMSGDVQISTSAASALSGILKGAELKILYTVMVRPPYQVWSTKSHITKFEQIKGMAVGIQTRGDTFEIGMRLTLIKHGMSPNSVSYTPLGYGGGRRAAISSGSLPVAVISPLDVERLRPTGALDKGHMLVDMRTTIEMPYSGIAVSNKLLRTNRNLAKRFLRATMKGKAYMLAFREGTIKNLLKYNKGATAQMLGIDYDTTVTGMTADGTVSDEMALRDAKIRAGLIKVRGKIRPLSEIYDYSIVREVNRELKTAGWKPTE